MIDKGTEITSREINRDSNAHKSTSVNDISKLGNEILFIRVKTLHLNSVKLRIGDHLRAIEGEVRLRLILSNRLYR